MYVMGEYTNQDMMDEIQKARDMNKIDIDEYLQVMRDIEALKEKLDKYFTMKLKYASSYDDYLIKRHNHYFLKKK